MTTHTRACARLAALGLFFVFASSSNAADVIYHGSLCNPVLEQAGQVFYNQFGIANFSSVSPLFVVCGGATPILATIHTVEVEVYDRNPGADVLCTLVLVDTVGHTISTSSLSSSGSQALNQLLRFNPGLGTHTFILQCSLPGATTSGVSHLTTYRVISMP